MFSRILTVSVVAVFAAGDACAELVGYWNFNEGSGETAFDHSANHNDGTLTAISNGNKPIWGPGHTEDPEDEALLFSQGYVRVEDSDSLHITDSFTIAAWMSGTGSNYGHLFVAGDGSANGRNWLLQTSRFGGDSAYFWSATDSSFQHRLGFIPRQNSWHHFAVTYDGAEMKGYFDGELVSKIPFAATLTRWGTLRLGGFNVFGSGFEGLLDDMIIFDSVEDVIQIMDGTHPKMQPPAPFNITAISRDGDLLTLTWSSVENEHFTVRYSTDLVNWDNDFADGAPADPEEETTRTFDLVEAGIATARKVFVRVEKEE